ncbi:transcription termination factor Rho [Micromonospora zhanjiangensis]|uniref:Transcription termination factor Rho n=1 Tax=Micromonospora zhanjiangensis TaxID=1522057 RepID=A0ABV8KVK2_9ACTN
MTPPSTAVAAPNRRRPADRATRPTRNKPAGQSTQTGRTGQGGRTGQDGQSRRDRQDAQSRRGGQQQGRSEQLVAFAGVVDTVDNELVVRVDNYLPSPDDVLVPSGLASRHGLRRGDEVTGVAEETTRSGGRRRAYGHRAVRLDAVNGLPAEAARRRPDFYDLTPLYPQQRLRLETDPHVLTTRVIDLVMPIGKGQRALIVSPPKAGKTMVLQAIGDAVARNHPEAHLIALLVDERPEEVTDMRRSVKGEVVAATFDRPPHEHIAVAELAVERAKRLVELGRDVVILLDSLTRLGRAYNLAAKSGGRTLSGGIDVSALHPPKRLLAAARNIENGGSLTIIASALVETGSAADTLIYEEFKSTGNAELKLDRAAADRRTFPAVDIRSSGTRKEDVLLAPAEHAAVRNLRGALSNLDRQQSIDQLVQQLAKSESNRHFLARLASPGLAARR